MSREETQPGQPGSVDLIPTEVMPILNDHRLSPRQQLFVMGMIRHGDRKKAAMEAGAKEQKALRVASHWLRDSKVRDAINAGMARKQEKVEIDAKRIVEELARVAFFNPKHILGDEGELRNLRDMPDEVAASIKKFRVSHKVGVGLDGKPTKIRVTEIEFWSKLDALKQLAQHLGLLKDTVKVTNVLALDWGSLMGRAGAAQADPVEERIKEASRQPKYLTSKGDALDVPDQIEGKKGTDD